MPQNNQKKSKDRKSNNGKTSELRHHSSLLSVTRWMKKHTGPLINHVSQSVKPTEPVAESGSDASRWLLRVTKQWRVKTQRAVPDRAYTEVPPRDLDGTSNFHTGLGHVAQQPLTEAPSQQNPLCLRGLSRSKYGHDDKTPATTTRINVSIQFDPHSCCSGTVERLQWKCGVASVLFRS